MFYSLVDVNLWVFGQELKRLTKRIEQTEGRMLVLTLGDFITDGNGRKCDTQKNGNEI